MGIGESRSLRLIGGSHIRWHHIVLGLSGRVI